MARPVPRGRGGGAAATGSTAQERWRCSGESEERASEVAAGDIGAPERVAELERKIGQQQIELDFFRKPCGGSRKHAGRTPYLPDGIYAVIQAMTIPLLQGELTIERMCVLAGVSRAGYYRHWRPPPLVWKKPACGTRSSGWRLRTGITAIAGSPRSCGVKASR